MSEEKLCFIELDGLVGWLMGWLVTYKTKISKSNSHILKNVALLSCILPSPNIKGSLLKCLFLHLFQFQDEVEEFPQLSVGQIDKLKSEAKIFYEQEAASYNSSK
jgi:hypothetical protein